MQKYQHPPLSDSQKKILKKVGNSAFIETLFALRVWKRYYFSAIKRGIRAIAEKHNNIAFSGHLELPKDFKFDEKQAVPRGNQVDGVAFSQSYAKNFLELPTDIQDLILSFKGIVENYFECDANLNQANIWRNFHIPASISDGDIEIFSNAFHQDLVFDQYNVQLFILLHDTDEEHGPFEYVNGDSTSEDMNFYRKRNRTKAQNESIKLTGKRGDFMLFTTGFTLHRAGIPHKGFHRDIFSIAFFPSYTKIGTPISELVLARAAVKKP